MNWREIGNKTTPKQRPTQKLDEFLEQNYKLFQLFVTDSLRAGAKSPAETTKECMEITLAIMELQTHHVAPN